MQPTATPLALGGTPTLPGGVPNLLARLPEPTQTQSAPAQSASGGLDPSVVALTKAIRSQESGGNYNATSKDGSYGAYQFLQSTWDSTAKKYGIDASWKDATPQQQNEVAYKQIADWKSQGYNVGQIASMWNAGAGKPNAYLTGSSGTNSSGVNYNVAKYAKNVASLYQGYKNGVIPDDGGSANATNGESNPTAGSSDIQAQRAALQAQGLPQSVDPTKAAPSFLGSLVRGIVSPLVRGANTVIEPLQKLATGNSQPDEYNSYLGDVSGYGQKADQTTGQRIKDALGGALQLGALALPGVGSVTDAIGGSIGKAALEGAIAGGAGSAGAELSNNPNSTVGSVLGQGALGAGTGGILGAAGGAVGKAVGGVADRLGVFAPDAEKTAQQVAKAEQNVAKVYEDTLPFTPTEKAQQANLLKRTGDNDYTTLAKYNINVGSDDAIPQLQSISDQFKQATQTAQKNEHAYFNVDEIKSNAEKAIDKNLDSEVSRNSAKTQVNNEIDAIVKANPSKVIKDVNGDTKVSADLVERLRKTGNELGQYNKLNPDTAKNAAGRGLADAVRDQVEKEGTFPAYRETNREWGKVIHAQQSLESFAAKNKSFKVPGGLSGNLARRAVGGVLGYHFGGLGGSVLGSIGEEYAAKILSSPELRTYFDRALISRIGKADATPEVIAKLADQIKAHVDASEARLQLPAAGESSASKIPATIPLPGAGILQGQNNIKLPNNPAQL